MKPTDWLGVSCTDNTLEPSDPDPGTLRSAIRMLTAALDASPAALAIGDPAGRLCYVNPRFLELTGYTVEDLAGQSLPLTRSGPLPEAVWSALRAGEAWRGDHLAERRGGATYRESEVISPVLDEQDELIGMISVREDISARVSRECHAAEADALDKLTGLLNGRAFSGALAEYLRQSAQGADGFSLILFELDDPADPPDGARADRALQELAERLRGCLRIPDLLARRDQGGFAVLLPGTSIDRAEVIAERLRHAAVAAPLAGVDATLSLGVTRYQVDDDSGGLLARADQALCRARQLGGNRVSTG